ncbi:hypothetical protein AVEN_141751-2-1, partial [Araneus ventricosus]
TVSSSQIYRARDLASKKLQCTHPRPASPHCRNESYSAHCQILLAMLDSVLVKNGDKVVQLTRFKTKEPLELFQVTLPNIEVNKGIWKITSLLYLKIKVVKFERKTGSIQCFNCNYWHHSTATCGFKPRCIKCGGQHAKDECTNPPETVTCINCKQEGHVASYRGCPMFPKSNKNPAINERKKITSRKTDPSIPYASHFNKKRLQVNIPPESQIDMDRVKEATTANYIPEVEANELKDILYVLNETKRLFAGSDIKFVSH